MQIHDKYKTNTAKNTEQIQYWSSRVGAWQLWLVGGPRVPDGQTPGATMSKDFTHCSALDLSQTCSCSPSLIWIKIKFRIKIKTPGATMRKDFTHWTCSPNPKFDMDKDNDTIDIKKDSWRHHAQRFTKILPTGPFAEVLSKLDLDKINLKIMIKFKINPPDLS